MKGSNSWSYAPYRPWLREVGDVYICRIAPGETSVHLEWLDAEAGEYAVFCRKKGDADFALCGQTKDAEFDIQFLETDTDYEFFVQAGDRKSRVRLARTGRIVGVVVNYLHPDDEAYSFSGRYLCSPSLVRHPEGYLLASMDVFAGNHPQNLTLIFRSDDEGESWHYVSELTPCFWGKMFVHGGEVYMLACATEGGDLLIGKSSDGGRTFSAPTVLLRGSNGKSGREGPHKNPQNLLVHGGRLYASLEWGSYQNTEYVFSAHVMSCAVDDDLLNPESWTFSEPRVFGNFCPETACLPKGTVPIEGTLVLSPAGKLLNILRFASYYLPMGIVEPDGDENLSALSEFAGRGGVIAYEADPREPGAALKYSHLIPLPTFAKFTVKYDKQSRKYYSLVSRVYDRAKLRARNVLSLFVSDDLKTFDLAADVIDYSDGDAMKIGFQYVDFEIEDDDIIFLSRTALNNAHNYHDANYSTFHRIKNFRNI